MRVCISILSFTTRTCSRTRTHTRKRTHACARTHARMHTRARAHTHTYSHTHTHTQAPAAVVEKAEAELADKREQLKTVTESIESILGQMPAADATGMCVCFAICPMP